MQRSMLGALEHDQKKMQINDAKLRAVKQRVEYEDFEKLVLGAHLKPVKPRSQESADVSKPFEHFVLPKYDAQPVAGPVMPVTPVAPATAAPPKNSNDFVRTWRRQCKTTTEKFDYLRSIAPETLPLLFRTELEPATFDGIADALRACVLLPTKEDPAAVTPYVAWLGQLLQQISRINRFELTLDFAEKGAPALVPFAHPCAFLRMRLRAHVFASMRGVCVRTASMRACVHCLRVCARVCVR